MIKKLPIYFFIINILLICSNFFSSSIAKELSTVEIKILKQNDMIEVYFAAKDKINFDIISEKNNLKIISYSPIKFIFKEDLAYNKDQLSIEISKNYQEFILKGSLLANLNYNQIEKKTNSFIYYIEDNNKLVKELDSNIKSYNSKNFFEVNEEQWYFNFNNQTASAVFFRANSLWVVFNKYMEFKVTPEILNLDKNIKNITQIPSQHETILCFELNNLKNVAIKKEKNLWILDWRSNSNHVINNRIPINQYTSSDTKGIFFPVKNYERKIAEFLDPEMQDTLKVIMTEVENHGVDYDQNFVDFRVNKTIQGMLINIFNDNSKIDLHQNGIELLSSGNLTDKQSDILGFIKDDKKNKLLLNNQNNNLINNSLLRSNISDNNYYRRDFLKIFNREEKDRDQNIFIEAARFYFLHQ